MKNYFSKLISSEPWLIHEKGWDKAQISVRESQFTLGNGLIGSRGILEEITYDSYPGTYIAGIYDKATSMVEELVNLPNPINFRIMISEEKLDVAAMDVLGHERILDMKKGMLFRKTIFSNRNKNRFTCCSMRFLSMEDKGFGAMRIFVTSSDTACELVAQTNIDTSTMNRGVLTEGRKKHYDITEVSRTKDKTYVCVESFDKRIPVAYASTLEIKKDTRAKERPYYTAKESLKFKLKKGQTICFTKLFYINSYATKNPDTLKNDTVNALERNIKRGLEKAYKNHINYWKRIWHICDIGIKGDPEAEKAVRFNIYHLVIAGNVDSRNAGIGARTLSGEGYRGHIFWDTEIFMLPFFIYSSPKIARNLLMYRYRRLNEARQIAKDKGYKGAMFPWESASSGFDVTPTWSKDFDGRIIKIRTNEFEHHITADIAYAVYYYYNTTHDIAFFLKYGLEMLFETARFWASRVEHNKKKGSYHIRGVIGPDEFHENINDNAFTNGLAKWNLFRASEVYRRFKDKCPQEIRLVAQEISLTPEEVKNWNYIASRISLITNKKTKIIEEFEGYFKKKQIRINQFTEDFMPVVPKNVKFRKIGETQLVKQADVLMLLYVLSSIFNLRTKRANYKFYLSRTLHKSSLSPSVHAIFAADVGDIQRAYQYFLTSALIDLKDINGNTFEGIHAASLGGVWQAVVNGFGGLRIQKGILCLNPRLPSEWEELKFNIFFRKFQLRFSINRKKLYLKVLSVRKKDQLEVRIFGQKRTLKADKNYVFGKKGG